MTKAALPPSIDNPAVARCAKAWRRAYKLVSESFAASGRPVDEDYVREQAQAAFRDALPPLRGEDNIRDFIACVAYALVKDYLLPMICTEYFDAAKVALSGVRAERHQPKSRSA
jgi:hypothetical protein